MKRLISFILCVVFMMFSGINLAQSDVQARVIAYELNVRSSYSDDSEAVGLLTVNTIVRVLGREDDPDNGGLWFYVSTPSGDITGWVLSIYLEFDPGFILTSVPVTNEVGSVQPGTSNVTPQVNPQTPDVQPEINPQDGIPGTTRALVNLRSGPGTGFDVVTVLPAQLSVTFTARNRSSTWLQTFADGTVGWLSYTFVNVDGSINALPIAGAGNTGGNLPPVTTGANPLPNNRPVASTLPGVVPMVGGAARDIYLRGQELGNNPGVFSKVGDSITASPLFLNPVGLGGAQLYDYAYLQDVINFFSQVPARDHFSFANSSLAARGSWTTFDVLNPERAPAGVCRPGETPLACEYRTVRPSVALIMLGTNDATWVNSVDFRRNMQQIVEISIDAGVIPVLSTIPDQPAGIGAHRVGEFNDIIIEVASIYGTPLWNYWLALQDLPNLGLGSDSIHPSYDPSTQETAIFSAQGLRYGYNMRNLTALMVLDAVWRGAMY